MAKVLLLFALLGAILASLPTITYYLTRREYPVPAKGSGVVISGTSTGIGYDAAVTLADQGFTVYAGVRKEKDADMFRALGKPNLVPVILDVAIQDSVDSAYEAIVENAKARQIPITAVLNNAGVMTGSTLEFHTLDSFHNLFNVNLYGALRLTQKFLPLLRESSGRIVMVSSVAGFMTLPKAACYCASKHAMEAVSDGLRLELSHFNVSVSVVQPGAVRSAIFDKAQQASQEVFTGKQAEVYAHLMKEFDPKMIEMADTPVVTSKAISHALVNPYPHTRYTVANLRGIPAYVSKILATVLPDRVMDKLMLSAF